MKPFLKLILLLLLPTVSIGQQYPYYHFPDTREVDSLRKVLPSVKSDTERMTIYRRFGFYYAETKRDSSLYFLNLHLAIARKFGLKLWEADALDNTAYALWRLGNYPGALQRFLQGIKIAGDPTSEKSTWGLERYAPDKNPRTARLIILAQLHYDLGTLYEEAGYAGREFTELSEGEKVATENHDKSALSQLYERLGSYYLSKHQTDSALTCLQKSVAYSEQSGFKLLEGDCLNYIGNAWLIKGDYAAVKTNILRSIKMNIQQNGTAGLTHNFLSLADLFIKQNNKDSSLYYAKKALALTKITDDLSDAVAAYNTLAAVFKFRNNIDSAYKYQGMALAAKDRLNNAEKVKQFENVGFTEQLHVQQLEEEKIAIQNKIRTYAMLAGLGVVLLIAVILYRNNRHKQKANHLLNEQKEEIESQRDNLDKAFKELKTTQTQLIQSEKMASLGELTAGIAHEIQNPLNFVNNFSEVNREMLEELKAESEKPKAERNEQLEIELINDIIQNEKKINHHGKRADSIVKGMLEHSRSSSGQKELTDLNVIADEYLRLSYHGLRSKDKSFNAEIIIILHPDLPKINVIPQDIGRVLLNLFNNAFYAVNQKAKTAGADYKPSVSVETFFLLRQGAEIGGLKVKDNGIGIPDAIKEKIMQPFFTTKPTGEGTGLGLSLTYDMVVKGHGGSIEVKSKEGEGSEFIVSLPINSNV